MARQGWNVNTSEKPQFLAALNELALLKHGARLSTEAYDAWWNALREKWTLADFKTACARLRDTVEYFPNPFHFEQLRRQAAEQSGEGWARALAHARSLPVIGGYLQERPMGDVRVDAVVRAIGGYRIIAGATERDLQFMAKRFDEHFESFTETLTVREVLPHLAAILDAPRSPADAGPRRLLGGAQ